MKIVIVGAGISGLTTWLYLQKSLPSLESHTIQIFESHHPGNALPTGQSNPFSSLLGTLSDSAPVIGNIIGIGSSTIRLLKQIDSRLYRLFKEHGYINETHIFRTARGHTIGIVPVLDSKDPPEGMVTCPRYSFWKLLHEIVGPENIQYRKVTEVDASGERPVVKLADGSIVGADLVIGADGARSVVRRALWGDEADGKYAAQYEGFAGVGSFLDEEIPESVTKTKSMVFTFGPTGSFGYCSAAPVEQRVLSWWSNWGVADIPDGNVMHVEDIRKQLYERHGTWKDPVIQHIIKNMKTDRIYPVWSTPDLPHWGENGVVLIGDAAHALRAMSGQGAGQAVEDTVTLCLLLRHYLNRSEESSRELSVKEVVALTSKALFEIRSPRTSMIRDRTRRMYLTKKPISNIFVEYAWYFMIYLCARYSWISYLVLGPTRDGGAWTAEVEIDKYLTERNH